MSDVVITVRGEHETRTAPDFAVAHLTVQTEGLERGPVVERVAALADPVRTDLEARQEAGSLREWSSQRVSVWSDRPWGPDGTRLAPVHHASVDMTATFADVAALSWWATSVAELEGVQLGWIDWQLEPAHRAEIERGVAAEAVRSAVTRAQAYARAIGFSTVTPLEIADLGLLARPGTDAAPQPRMMKAAMAMEAYDTGGGPAVQLRPEDIVISAAVEARFSAK
jgi:uncharacterized protein